jgi:hypothetical protein
MRHNHAIMVHFMNEVNGAKVAFTDLEMVLELCRSSNAAAFVDVGWQLFPWFCRGPRRQRGQGEERGALRDTRNRGKSSLCVRF